MGDVREEGGDLALAVVRRAAVREVGVRAGGVQERVPRVEAAALAPAPGLGLDAVEERVGDDATNVRAAAAAAAAAATTTTARFARARPAPLATVGVAQAAVAVLAAAVAVLAAAVLRGGRAGGGAQEERRVRER